MRVVPDRVGHAYLLEGGAGLLEYANAFAKALNCLQGGAVACNACISCRVFDSGNHPDTIYVVNTGEKSKTKDIGVNDVREQIVLPMATKPFNYKYKIFIVDKAETLTPPAQNALLKTIEEPAPYGVFLLLTAKIELILETVRSRCVIVKVDAAQHTSSTVRAFPAGDADETRYTAMHELVREVTETAHAKDILGALALYKKIEPYKDSKELTSALLDTLYEGYGTRIRITQDAHAIRAAKAITHTKEILSQNGNFQLAMELMLLRIGGHIA